MIVAHHRGRWCLCPCSVLREEFSHIELTVTLLLATLVSAKKWCFLKNISSFVVFAPLVLSMCVLVFIKGQRCGSELCPVWPWVRMNSEAPVLSHQPGLLLADSASHCSPRWTPGGTTGLWDGLRWCSWRRGFEWV